MRKEIRDRLRGCLLGVAVGDALGAPFEHIPPGQANQIMEKTEGRIIGFHPYQGYPAGSWTDDTGLTLATCKAFIRMETMKVDLEESFREAFTDWVGSKGCRKPGRTMVHAAKHGKADMTSWSNGSLMHISPVAFYAYMKELSLHETAMLAYRIAGFTHKHPLAVFPSVECVLALTSILKGEEVVPQYLSDPGQFFKEHEHDRYSLYLEKRHAQLETFHPSTGLWMWKKVFEDVLGLSEEMLWSSMPSFEIGVLKAVNESYDRDTAGAVAGAVLGTYWGEDAIPVRWKNGVEDHDAILALAEEMLEVCGKRHVPVQKTEGYDWDFRPSSYWVGPRTQLTNIMGEKRRRAVEQAISDGELEIIPDEMLEVELSEDLLEMTGRVHPAFMGGEYLAAYMPGEIEIARICLDSTTADVISVRARKGKDGLIYYRVVDEYEDTKDEGYTCQPEGTVLPLTFREIVSLIDSVEGVTGAGWPCKGQTSIYRDLNYDEDPCKQMLDEMVDFVTVSSDFYPEIGQWYRQEAQEWYRKRLAELGLDQDEVDDLDDELP